MKLLRKILIWFLYLLAIPFFYFIVSLVFTAITVNNSRAETGNNKTVFLSTNGVHLDIVLSKSDMSQELLEYLIYDEKDEFLSFGWGDEDFYLNAPTWNVLTFRTAFNAMFLKSNTLLHVTRYRTKQRNWVLVELSNEELKKINRYLFDAFKHNSKGEKMRLVNKGYSKIDEFYKANGSYSCFYTCNSWVNAGFKESGLKSCYWTPFDFGLLGKYE